MHSSPKNDGKKKTSKVKPLSNSGSASNLAPKAPSAIDNLFQSVFAVDPVPGAYPNSAKINGTNGKKPEIAAAAASQIASNLRPPQLSEAHKKWRVKLESLDENQVRASAIGEPSLAHLTSGHKRKPGYLDKLPPLAVLLEERGIDYARPNAERDVQLPLEAFEDATMCTRQPEEWHALMHDPATKEPTPIMCTCLRLQGDGSGRWELASAHSWLPDDQRYLVKWASGAEEKVLNMHVLFEGDDPVLFADRLAKALKQRRWAHSLLKYHFFIDSMPEDMSRKMGKESVERISKTAKDRIWDVQSEFAEKLERKLESLTEEAQKEYRRVQNLITFEKVQTQVVSGGQNGLGSVLGDLQLPPSPPAKEVPYLAVKVLPCWHPSMGPPDPALPRDFAQAYEWFCKASLLIRPEVCGALQVTRGMCLDLLVEHVFDTDFKQPMRIQEFVECQEAATTRLKGRLGMWVNTIRMQITTRLQQATVKWYHLHETNIDNYRASRLRPLLVAARLMMSNAILLLADDNLASYVQAIEAMVPLRLDFGEGPGGLKNVVNVVKDPKSESGERRLEPLFKQTLFKVEVVIRPPDDEPPPKLVVEEKGKDKKKEAEKEPEKPKPVFAFTTLPCDFQKAIQSAFDRGVSAFQNVHSVESVLLPHLIRDEKLDPNFTTKDDWVVDLKRRADAMCTLQEPWLDHVLEILDAFQDVIKLDPQTQVKKMKDGETGDPKETRRLIEKHLERAKEVLAYLPDDREPIPVGFYRIDLSAVRTSMSEKLEQAAQMILHCLADSLDGDISGAKNAFGDMFEKLKEEVSNIEELSDMRDYLKSIPGELSKMQGAINDAMGLVDMVEELRYVLPAETLDNRWRMYAAPGEVKKEMRRVEEYLDNRFKDFRSTQENEQQVFEKRLETLEATIESFADFKDLGQVREVAEKTASTSAEIEECKEKVRLFNSREVLFDRDQTDYSSLGAMVKTFEPYANLWKTAGDWVNNKNQWLTGDFESINPKYTEDFVNNGIRLLFKTIRTLKEDEEKKSIVSIADQIKTELEEFKPYLPLVLGLRNEGIRERHWEQISKKCGVDIGPGMEGGMTLQRMLDVGVLQYAKDVEEVGDRAGKEFQLEKALRKMKGDWEEEKFDLSEKYRKTNTYILKGEGVAMTLLDEHIVLTQAMMFSMFKGPFEEEIDEWNSRLMRVSETLDEWLKCQRSWMYLQPIFESDDIMKQLPTEGKRFKHVDATWRSEMNNTRENPKIIEACAVEGLMEKWRECNLYLDMVQKGLEDYLETKRNAFARFYFLSNDELLEILSQSKDPTRVQPFLSKVFEAISKITFTGDLEITEMRSPENEVIPFVQMIPTHGKSVETWMGEVESGMTTAIRNVMEIGVTTYPDTERPVWVLENIAQVTLNASQVHWTREVEEAFKAGEIPKYAKQLSGQINDLVFLLRKGLSKAQRTSIGALIVVDVHARDVLDSFVENKIFDVSAFEWISQLRYYWEQDDKQIMNLAVKCVQTSFPYGYEYLGNSMRLVITPLTDMCYITLMGAQSLSLGGAPAGPAGTGKTETTKDLAKALAKQCVVFNCSPEMDYIMVGKFFKGLAFSGAWCCFDEFNRINIEVLSVIAQQLLQLFGKKAELVSYSDTAELEFEGTLIVMKPTFNVFITMNPGYAGRAELPDNLAALFRPVAMMVPDYALIGEIMFYAYGFTGSRALAQKMVTTFKLSSEQLSSQCHYDYGMRAVKSTIEAGGKLKSELGETWEEDQITLRALRDVNVPKFLKDDLPLFENIIKDLFPTTKRPEPEYGDLHNCLKESAKELVLQLPEIFTTKIVQLIDTIGVRHGLMLVGPTGGGKTCNYRILQHTSGLLKDRGDSTYEHVQTHILNPKSITQAQLYGAFDEVTREWQDGIASEQVRISVASGKSGCPDKHWVIFDGPVDALWIESMNTVLDDNKKLCLTSGEIIALTPQMRMVFEVEDLSVASPATVSRCGMVYMEPESLGLEPLIESWCQKLPTTFKKEQIDPLHALLNQLDPPMIRVTRKKVRELSATVDNNLVASHFRLLDCHFSNFIPSEARTPSADEMTKLVTHMLPLFLFTLTWSIGASCDNKGRPIWSKALWAQLDKHGHTSGGTTPLENGSSFYDYIYFIEGEHEGQWLKWLDWAPPYQVPRNAEYQNIVVPTVDSIRLTHTFATLLKQQHHAIITGNTGTGKSVYVTLWLQKAAPDNCMPLFINFSAQTGVNQFQDLLDSKFEKRRRGVYGPPTGKFNVIFVDDLNMPKKEYYGAQPPIELIRQWMDYGGWFNRKELRANQIIDICWVSGMGPPGGGRTEITGRLRRHYNTMVAADLARESITKIFETITKHFLAPFEASIHALETALVETSLVIFERAIDELLPTPAKSHYTFNLRDIWKVFQGICTLNAKKVTDPVVVLRCWAHENKRVFADRLINTTDRDWFQDVLNKLLEEQYKKSPVEVFDKERLIFADFMGGGDTKFYLEIEVLEKMKECMEGYLDDYNNMFSVAMPLVMFFDACEHVCRIARVLRQPNGNALLLGVGGSGRQSLSRLASFIVDYDLFQIEVVKGYGMSEFKDDLKTCLMKCGNEQKTTAFLFADTQIVKEDFVESLNNVLNSGDVPNLYKQEDTDVITMACRAACQAAGIAPTKANIFSTYVTRVKACLHVVLAFSPVGDIFRTRLRMFPSLVNCCTIDWFAEWPAEALYSVGKQQMTIEDLNLANLEGVLRSYQVIHQSVEKSAAKVLDTAKRSIYITPTSFLELITTFKKVLGMRRKAVGTIRNRLQKGLDALKQAAWAVANMEDEIRKKQPILEQTNKDVAAMMIVITNDKAKAAVTKEECTQVEVEASAQAESAGAIKADAEKDLNEALPALEVAQKALRALKLSNIQEVKALGDPPAGVKLAMEAICIMFQVKPVKKADPNNAGKKFDDYWEASKNGPLSDPKKMLEDLFEFDKDNIPEAVITKIQPYIDREDFDPAAIKKSSVACEALCMWARAMHKYHFVAKAVEPKRRMLAAAEADLEQTMTKLRAAQAQLKEVEDKIAQLERDYNSSVAQQESLKHEMEMCTIKLGNATKLIEGLGGEKERWEATVEELNVKYELLGGDSLVASGMVAYAGPFVSEYRIDFEDLWRETMRKENIAFSEGANLVHVLGEPVQIQQWSVCGLPNDNLSVENGIILAVARRWPLMIDPQRQANKFIKLFGKASSESGMNEVKPSDPSMLQTLEVALQLGRWVLLENIGENLDPALEPILQQQKIKDGSSFVIKMGDKTVNYDDKFRFFMTTTLSNPHYTPETSVKVTILNFAITPEGLQDQMLGIVVQKEQPEMEEKKQELVKNNAAMNKTLKEIEDKILELLSADGDILESKELIDVLETSKKTSAVINKAMEEAKVTEKEIDEVRKSYKDYAFRSQILFFCVSELSVIDPMYQFSLQWFQQLAGIGIDNAPAGETQDIRLQNLIDYFTYAIYQSVCRGLFEKHKLLLSFSLCMKIMGGEGRIVPEETRFLLAGPTGEIKDGRPNPAPEWISQKAWNEVMTLSHIKAFVGLDEDFGRRAPDFKKIYDVPEADTEPLPGDWEKKLLGIQRLCFLRTLRPDRLTTAVLYFVSQEMGQKFVEPPVFDISISYEDSTKMSPLIFVLSPGSDPVAEMLQFAEIMNMSTKLESISLGQGQGPKAARMIDNARQNGGWVLLCNCHLSVSWLPDLERICEQMNPEETDGNFRLWLTSMPTKQFPTLLLQNGVKMTNEPPKGLRANVLGSMSKADDRMLNDCENPAAFQRLFFAFCFFHAVCQDRRKFGPIGWNVPYNFTLEDLVTNRRQLKYFLDNYEDIPYKVLRFLGAKINYGGRVTDKMDKRLIEAIIAVFINVDVVVKGPEYKFSKGGLYYCPVASSQDEFLAYLKTLPITPSPEIFGLHENCELTCAESEAMQLLEDIMSTTPRGSGGGGKSADEVMDEMADDIQKQTPEPFNLDDLEEAYPTKYEESRNTVLKQESLKFNRLILMLKANVPVFRKALKGFVAMTEDLEAIGKGLYMNMVPDSWAAVSFLSMKPMTAWMKDLNLRVDFMRHWVDHDNPIAFWISGLFFPQAFLTATLQNFARSQQIAIDRLTFDFIVHDEWELDGSNLKEPPDCGTYAWGMFLEGCRWDAKTHVLGPSLPKQLFVQFPVVHFVPMKDRKGCPPGYYPCPVYRVLSRKGTLSTTGHSTNFVLDMDIPSADEPDYWIRAGVAAFLSLKY